MSKIAIGQDGSSVNKSAKNKFGLIQGLDTRVRYNIKSNIWLGMRYSQVATLVGSAERGRRFRIETAIKF